MKKCAVFDVCGTITHTNNTSQFINYVLRRTNYKRFLFFRILIFLSYLQDILRKFKLVKKDHIRIATIKLFKGYSEKKVHALAGEYVQHIIARNLFNNEILSEIRKRKRNHDNVILVSASIDPPIIFVAKYLNIQTVYTSKLEIKNGRYTGELESDLLDNKKSIIANLDFKLTTLYTDNEEDLKLTPFFDKVIYITNDNLNYGQKVTTQKYPSTKVDPDINSINKKNSKWAYLPMGYYTLSRFHSAGISNLLLVYILPLWFFLSTYSNIRPIIALYGVLIGVISFFSIYELGGLFNDLHAQSEMDPTSRLSPEVTFNIPVIMAVRALVVILAFSAMTKLELATTPYLIGSVVCMILYTLHTIIGKNKKILTFIILRILRPLTPLLLFVNILPVGYIFIMFFLIDGPERILIYARKKFTKQKRPISTMERILIATSTIVLCAALYYATDFTPFIYYPIYAIGIASIIKIISNTNRIYSAI